MSKTAAVKEAIDKLDMKDEIKVLLLQIHEEVSGAYEDREKEKVCKNCKHWTIPSWDTNGFGTCYLNSHLRDNKQLRVLSVQNGEWVTTHETFGCIKFETKESVEDAK